MSRHRVDRLLRFLPLFVLGFALFGLGVMALWNALMPPIFGLKALTYWQAWGLLVLCKLLFGGFFGPGGRAGYRVRERIAERMAERWEQMTPEEQAAVRQWFRNRRGGGAPPESKPSI